MTEPGVEVEQAVTGHRIARARRLAAARVTASKAYLERERKNVVVLDVVLDTHERDRAAAGSLLAVALAYRFFAWLLPVALVLTAVLGFVAAAHRGEPADAAKSLGLSSYVASSVATAADEAKSARWITAVIGLWALYRGSISAAKAVFAVHCLAWREKLRPPPRPFMAGLCFTGAATAGVALTAATGLVRHASYGAGLAATLAVVVAYAGLWFATSLALPHGDAPWTALIPGAVLVSVGFEAIHLVSVYYLAEKLQTASQVYGVMGGAVTVLLWLFFVGRLMVASPVLNATWWDRRRADDPR